MDTQLKELIDKIKQEGVEAADNQAKSIISDAEQKARQIIAEARSEAEHIIQAGKAEADKFAQAGKSATQQAARDVLLQTQNQLQQVFAAVIKDETRNAFSSDMLEKTIVSLMQNWKGQAVENLALMIPEEEFSAMEKGLRSKLAEKLKQGMEIVPNPKVAAGFRVGEKDGSAFFEISAQSLAEMMAARANVAIGEIIQTAAEKG
ncbi:MAG: V-type ATP synthase subunit E [Spirochaetaceae bacterium]|nr:MAG: V-type ATP synthase subunit E [Spirochaetaceae bacterium]